MDNPYVLLSCNFFGSLASLTNSAQLIKSINEGGIGTFLEQLKPESAAVVAFCCISILLDAVLCLAYYKKVLPEENIKYLVYLLALLWAAGVATFTFHEPFLIGALGTTNGFFGVWLAFISALLLLSLVTNTDMNAVSDRNKFLYGILIASVVIIIQGIQTVVDDTSIFDDGVSGYSIALGAVMFAFTSSTLCMDDETTIKYIIHFLLLWALIGALITTSIGPFALLQNGYVAVWFNVVATSFLIATYYPRDGVDGDLEAAKSDGFE